MKTTRKKPAMNRKAAEALAPATTASRGRSKTLTPSKRLVGWNAFLEAALREGKVAIDTETTGLRVWHGDTPYSVQFCLPSGKSYFFEWNVSLETGKVMPIKEELNAIRQLMGNHSVLKIFHNAKFDVRMLENCFGIYTCGQVHDTRIMFAVVDSSQMDFKLKRLARDFLNYPSNDEEELHKAVVSARRWARKFGFTTEGDVEATYWCPRAVYLYAEAHHPEFIASGVIPKSWLTVSSHYGVQDVERTILLYMQLLPEIKRLKLETNYERECNLWPRVYRMETRGARIHKNIAVAESRKASEMAFKMSAPWRKLGLDVDKPAQLKEYLFTHLKLNPTKFTGKFDKKTGKPNVSTDAEALELMQHPMVAQILEYRSANKLVNTYLGNYLEMAVDEGDGVCAIHPSFDQTGAKTLRFSCRDPNLQNLPDPEKNEGSILMQARAPFGPRPGHRWYLLDYSQIEPRLFAEMAQEPTMLKAFSQGRDVYIELAQEMARVTDNPIKDDHDLKMRRKQAKAILLGVIYGMGTAKLAKQLGCSIHEAKTISEGFDKAFPRIKQWSRAVIKKAERDGFVITNGGHRLPVERGFEYKAPNIRCQGWAASYMKDGIIRMDTWLQEHHKDIHILLTIHDELVIEVPEAKCVKTILRMLCKLMAEGDAKVVNTPVGITRVRKRWDKETPVYLGKHKFLEMKCWEPKKAA